MSSRPEELSGQPFPAKLAPMLLQLCKEPFTREGWIFEPKLDGMRCIAYVENGRARLFSKPGRDITETFPTLSKALSKQPTGVYDGEIVAHNDDGSVSFERLQGRWALLNTAEISREDRSNPVSFYAFDVLHLGADSLFRSPLLDRRNMLESNFRRAEHVHIVEQFSDGIAHLRFAGNRSSKA
ncbi:MAG TPA: hypothetical protein V6C81_02185 [Planktothrix sp.]|jgi:ATP-dependent DNA ligase